MAIRNEEIRVGDFVIGIGYSYSFTNEKGIMEVVREREYRSKYDADIDVRIIAHRDHSDQVGCVYPVQSELFRLATREELEWYRENYDINVDINDLEEASDIEAPTLMDKTWTVPMSNEYFEKAKKWSIDLLNEFDYDWSYHAIEKIINIWNKNKQWLEVLFSKHPNWDDERKMIVLKKDILRKRDQRGIEEVCYWLREKIRRQHAVSSTDIALGIIPRNECEYGWSMWYRVKEYNIIDSKMCIVNILHRIDQMIDKYNADDMNSYIKGLNIPRWNIHTGQKASRIFTRFCKEIGIEKDSDFNTMQAKYGDAINPCNQTFWFCISINHIDFWTMSFGKNWASCHTLDKENRRGGTGNYSGCYSSGTTSYMLDPSSFIVYTVLPKDQERYGHEEKDFMFADKHRRCVFWLGEDKLIQSRVYPDGRDGGEEGIGKTFREIVEEVISTCLGVDNQWKYKGGTGTASSMIKSYGTHYHDYCYYEDVGTAFLKRKGVVKNRKTIIVGHNPICPNCGEEHYYEENILCESCAEEYEYHCDECGNGFNEYDDDAIFVDDQVFCCPDCADNAGYVYCDNIGEWCYRDSSYVYCDDWSGEYFYDSYGDGHIVTEDGYHFICEYNAKRAGYRQEYITDEWVREEDLYYCDECDHWFYEENFNTKHNCCSECAENLVEENADTELESVSA